MDMSVPRNTSLLEKWLEDMPNSNNSVNVKKERNDFRDIFATNSCNSSSNKKNSNPIPNNSLNSANNSTTHSQTNSSAVNTNQSKTNTEEIDDKSSAVDSSSIKGVFGWQTVNDIPLPVILREEERLVAVRIVESKIILHPLSQIDLVLQRKAKAEDTVLILNICLKYCPYLQVIAKFSAYLPWNVFSCINIKSYYVTENEAQLLNDINTNHCEYQFGYERFTTKDVVVCLPDVITLYKFLDTSKDIFSCGLSKSGINWLGFINISGSLIVPYIAKRNRDSKIVDKYVPQSLVQKSVLLVKVEKIEMTEWDASYLRMLCVYAGIEHIQSSIQSNDSLCLLNDLKWDSSLCPLHIEECSPPSQSNSKLNANKELTYQSSGVVSRTVSNPLDESNAWLMTSQASTSSNALRSLHQITRVDINGFSLKAINLKPYSTQAAVFVSDVVTKMFRGVSILTAHYILEKILQVKLYECTRLHEDAFVRSGVRPLQGDKLVAVDVLRKCLPQLRQIIMAGMPPNPHS